MEKAHEHRTPRGVKAGAASVTLLPRAPYDVAYTPTETVAGFAFDIQTGSHAFGGDRVTPFLTMPHSLALTPAGCDIRSRSDRGGDYLTVTIEPGQEEACFGTVAGHGPRRYSNGVDCRAGSCAARLRRLLLADETDATAVEEAAVLLYEAALDARPAAGKPASSLTRARMARLHGMVEDRFSEALSVADMAAAVGLSTSFFIRAFAAATGLTPHAYLTERRLGEARQRLSKGKDRLSDIAVACGFSSQAHMTSLFGRTFGITPKAYRALVA